VGRRRLGLQLAVLLERLAYVAEAVWLSRSHPIVPASIGEVADKITILEIKARKLPSPMKERADEELLLLRKALGRIRLEEVVVTDEWQGLSRTNAALWDVEDALRERESQEDFGVDFVELARSVYRLNDQRFLLKKALNDKLGSNLVEVKGHDFD